MSNPIIPEPRCPYCKREVYFSLDNDVDWGQETCHICKKKFTYFVEHITTAKTFEAACLNGGGHIYKNPHYPNRPQTHCWTCHGEKIVLEKEG